MAEINDDESTYYGVTGEHPRFRAKGYLVQEWEEGAWETSHGAAIAACLLTNQVVRVDENGNFISSFLQ